MEKDKMNIEEIKKQAKLAESWLSCFPKSKDGEIIFMEPSDEEYIGFAESLIAAVRLLEQVEVLEQGTGARGGDLCYHADGSFEWFGHNNLAPIISVVKRNDKPVVYIPKEIVE